MPSAIKLKFSILLLALLSIGSNANEPAHQSKDGILIKNGEAGQKLQSFIRPVINYKIDCYDRTFELTITSEGQQIGLFVVKHDERKYYSIPQSPLSKINSNNGSFVSPNFLCAERGLSVYLEGYDLQPTVKSKPYSAKLFLSDNGVLKDVTESEQHADILEVASRLSSVSIVNSLTRDSKNMAKFHGPWLPKSLDYIQKMSCADSVFELNYSPDNKSLFLAINNNNDKVHRDFSNTVLLRILAKRNLYLKQDFRCQEDGVDIKYQGVTELSEDKVEPISLLIKLNDKGVINFFEQKK